MSPEEQYQFVADFNWDDQLEPILEVLASSHCQFSTALLAFWRLEGPWYLVGELPNHPHRELLDRLAQDLGSDRYPRGSMTYDPVATEGLSRTQVYKFQKAGLPDLFLGIR